MEIEKPDYYPKGWCGEYWIANSEKYCGKLLKFIKGKKCSFHSHKLKTENFFLQSGKMILRVSYHDELENAEVLILNPGDSFFVPPGLRHQMEALEDSELFEFSTQHFESDSYRIVRGD